MSNPLARDDIYSSTHSIDADQMASAFIVSGFIDFLWEIIKLPFIRSIASANPGVLSDGR